jgi:serine/threonine-protein kinase
MLTGQRAFKRDTQPETMTAILKEDPPSFAESGGAVAPEVIRTVERCLEKKPDRRFQSAADLAFALRSVAGGADEVSTGPVEVATVPTWPRLLPWALLLLAALVAVVATLRPWRDAPTAESPVARLTVTLPEGDSLEGLWPALAISSDGSRLVLSVHRGGDQRLYWRQIDEFELTEIPGTDGAVSPFFSPDGNWVGFSVPSEHKLKKVSLVGGSPQTLCTCDARDANWGEDGTIVFAGYPRPELFRVSADGGEPEPLTSRDASFQADEIYHLGPQILPGNEEVLFTATDATMRGRVAVLSLATGERHTVIEGGTYGRYLPSGHIVYVLAAEGDLLAVPFDIGSLEVTGNPVPVLGGLKTTNLGSAFFTVSDIGTLAYVAGPPAFLRRPAWVDHQGRIEVLPFPPAYYMSPRVAPDGRRMSVAIAGEGVSVWLLDSARGTSRRFTDEHGNEFWQIWSPDGKDIIYNSFGGDLVWEGHLLRKPVDGSGPEVLLQSFADSSTGFDIWALPLDDDRAPIPLIKTRFNEIHPTISPDGRWLAYGSDESGRYEVYVRSYPDTGELIQISTDGGFEPLWAPGGTQLYYRRENHGGTVLAVSVRGVPTLSVGKPRVLFEATRPGGSSRFFSGLPYGRNYDISPDGERFLVLEMEPDPPIAQVNVVLNWFDELERLVPTE